MPVRSVSDTALTARLPPASQRGRALAAREQRSLLEEFAAPPDRGADAAAPVASAESAAAPEGMARLLSNFVVMRRQRQRLDVDLVCGSITDVRADAYVIGVFRNVERLEYGAEVARQIDEEIERKGPGDLAALLRSGATWEVG